ncbi:MAG: hypothetical protein JW830_05780 [Bacteroidales bacterium]|nr:hypothetical protein [Bacteroidales bacterium]
MKKPATFLFTLILLSLTCVSYSQEKIDSSEITSEVPELFAFHEVIYPMWHDAYPAKDYEALKGFVPQIKTSVEAINSAKLPGILREREGDWKTRLNELNTVAASYYAAAEENNQEALLEAAEKLHHEFEMMMRVIRPAIRELDEYHQTLYIIYHKLLPEKKYDEIAGLTENLIVKAAAVAAFPQEKLKRRLGDRIPQFDAAAKELLSKTVALKEVLKANDAQKNNEAIEVMHTAYQQLDAVFH